MLHRTTLAALIAILSATSPAVGLAQRGGASNAADSIKYKYESSARLSALKAEAAKEIDARAKMIQEMVDQVFSFPMKAVEKESV